MGGKIQGFLGAVLLTTTVAYFTSQEFKQNQEFISKTLRDTERIINQEPQDRGQTPRSLEFQYRPSIRQTVADLWDDSVLSSVQWIYGVDVEKSIGRVVSALQEGVEKITKQ
jgi:altered-inheritance-of-mitochondria protein 5